MRPELDLGWSVRSGYGHLLRRRGQLCNRFYAPLPARSYKPISTKKGADYDRGISGISESLNAAEEKIGREASRLLGSAVVSLEHSQPKL